MKIGVFTFFQANYGAVLQAFALQRYLEKQPNTEVEIVDFTTDNHLLDQKVFQKQKTKNPIKLFLYFFFTIIHYRQLKRRIRRTEKFKAAYFNFSPRYSSIDEVLRNHPQEDIYITGSDQVFNPNARYVPVYYLNFKKDKGKKVAYAPSFGISVFDDKVSSKIVDYIKDFDFLSCRESAGAEYLRFLTGKDVPVVVDPVLLHDAEEWNKVAIIPKYKKDYIFIYDLNGGENLIKIAKNIQKHTNLPIVCLTNKRTKIYPVNKQLYDAGPAEFIGWIKEASYVVTDSFHGTVFSLIYGKQFFTFIALEKTSSRIKNILEKVELVDRIIEKENICGFDIRFYKTIEPIQINSLSYTSKLYIQEFLK